MATDKSAPALPKPGEVWRATDCERTVLGLSPKGTMVRHRVRMWDPNGKDADIVQIGSMARGKWERWIRGAVRVDDKEAGR